MVWKRQIPFWDWRYLYWFTYARYDAAERGYKIGRALSFIIAMFMTIGFPWYLIRVRRFPMGKAISVTFFWMLLFVGVSFAGAYLLHSILDLVDY